MTKIQKIVLGCLAALAVIGLVFLTVEYQDEGGRRDKKMSQNIDNLRKIRKHREKNPDRDYFQRKEELMWGGGKSGGRERDVPKTPFDDLINHPGY